MGGDFGGCEIVIVAGGDVIMKPNSSAYGYVEITANTISINAMGDVHMHSACARRGRRTVVHVRAPAGRCRECLRETRRRVLVVDDVLLGVPVWSGWRLRCGGRVPWSITISARARDERRLFVRRVVLIGAAQVDLAVARADQEGCCRAKAGKAMGASRHVRRGPVRVHALKCHIFRRSVCTWIRATPHCALLLRVPAAPGAGSAARSYLLHW